MTVVELKSEIEALWSRRGSLGPGSVAEAEVVRAAVGLLDSGEARVAEVAPDGDVVVNEWLKLAVLLLFKVSAIEVTELGPFEYADRLPLKHGFEEAGVRVVPGASARWGSFIGRGAVMMPSYVNIGAHVGAGTMVDTWATVGSCAQVGEGVHLSGGVGIGGVLEPPQAAPVMIGDHALIGSRCMITQGVVPPWCVGLGATRPRTFAGGTFGLPCILVVRWLEEGQRHSSAQLEDMLREHGVSI